MLTNAVPITVRQKILEQTHKKRVDQRPTVLKEPERVSESGSTASNMLISYRLGDNGQSCTKVMPRQHLDSSTNFKQSKRLTAEMTSNNHTSNSAQARPDALIDQKLVARVQKGDKRAFDLLVVKYQSRVASIVSRYVSDYHEVSDVTQEAFIKAYRAIDRFRGDSAFYTWVYRIAINCAKNYLQAKGRRPPSSDIDVNDAEHLSSGRQLKDLASPETILNKDQLENVITQTINKLPEDLRVALTLREFDHLSYEEIAEIMACPVGTVRSRIFRAREAVDKEINIMRGN